MSEKYQPSNGSEGEGFFEAWCMHCARDKAMREGAPVEDCDDDELCPIIAATFAHDIDDPAYPVEWIMDADGPRCTAFVPAGETIRERCRHTAELFPKLAADDQVRNFSASADASA